MRYLRQMRSRKVYLATLFILTFATSPSVRAWDEEILNGHYSSVSRDLSITFDWKLSGIKNVRINSKKYDDKKVFLEKFGDTECYQIRVQEGVKASKLIQVVFLLRKETVLFASGYFADLKDLSEDGDFKVATVRSIVLKHTPLRPSELE